MRGSVVYLCAFDVASEIRTSAVREVLSERPAALKLRAATALPKDVLIYRPLVISLPPVECRTSVGRITLLTTVKVFEVGVLSIAYQVAFEVDGLARLVPFHQLRVADRELAVLAEELCDRVTVSLRPFLVKPTRERPPAEAYTVFCLEAIIVALFVLDLLFIVLKS